MMEFDFMGDYVGFLMRAGLLFSNEWVIISLLILGYIWIDERIFFYGVCLVLVSVIFNVALKVTFQVPLDPLLGKEGFAFPSGHMQTSMVLYGFLYTFVRNVGLRLVILMLLVMIGASLIYFGYHNLVDIIGAVIVSLVLIGLYKVMLRRVRKSTLFFGIIVFGAMSLVYIGMVYKIPGYAWDKYYTLLGLLSAQYYFIHKRKVELRDFKSKCFATLFSVLSLFFLSKMLLVESLKWFSIGVFIPFSIFLSDVIFRRWAYFLKFTEIRWKV